MVTHRLGVVSVCLLLSVIWWVRPARGDECEVLYKQSPITVRVATLPGSFKNVTTTDVEVADFTGDGSPDIAVLWQANSPADNPANLRRLSVFSSDSGEIVELEVFDLYIYNAYTPALSIFRNGTSELAIGDFDGDGDADLAAFPQAGDEFWVIENLLRKRFATHLFYMMGFNGTELLTPPEAAAADFDGDGRDELVFVVDPIYYPDGQMIHFWKTDGSIAALYRTDWEGAGDGVVIQWTRALAVDDFDADGRPDLAFTGCSNPPQESNPLLTVWYNQDPLTGTFETVRLGLPFVCSDVVGVKPPEACRAGFIVTDHSGQRMQFWKNRCSGAPAFEFEARIDDFSGYSPNRGMTACVADVDGDGDDDLVVKQKLGNENQTRQIEIALSDDLDWERVDPTPISTEGFSNITNSQILRPRNLAVADVTGNSLPEVVAGFAASSASDAPAPPTKLLDIAIWQNSCEGDADGNGRADPDDVAHVLSRLGACRGEPDFDPPADLDKDGCVTQFDVDVAVGDLGCLTGRCPQASPGDLNCDCVLDFADCSPFTTAVVNRSDYERLYPHCSWYSADVNQDGAVNTDDVPAFVELLLGV